MPPWIKIVVSRQTICVVQNASNVYALVMVFLARLLSNSYTPSTKFPRKPSCFVHRRNIPRFVPYFVPAMPCDRHHGSSTAAALLSARMHALDVAIPEIISSRGSKDTYPSYTTPSLEHARAFTLSTFTSSKYTGIVVPGQGFCADAQRKCNKRGDEMSDKRKTEYCIFHQTSASRETSSKRHAYN